MKLVVESEQIAQGPLLHIKEGMCSKHISFGPSPLVLERSPKISRLAPMAAEVIDTGGESGGAREERARSSLARALCVGIWEADRPTDCCVEMLKAL